MGKLYIRHGTVNSGKTLELISTYYSYKLRDKNAIILKSCVDTRNKNKIVSRAGVECDCISVGENENIIDIINKENEKSEIDVIIFDETQFFTNKQIKQIIDLSSSFNVICYTLKSDYTGKLFNSYATLEVFAEDIKEIKTMCMYCNKKAILSLRLDNGVPVYSGETVKVEKDISKSEYFPVCKAHYYNPLV